MRKVTKSSTFSVLNSVVCDCGSSVQLGRAVYAVKLSQESALGYSTRSPTPFPGSVVELSVCC